MKLERMNFMPKDLERLPGGVWYELGHKGWMGVSREGCRVLMDSWGREPGNIPLQGALLLSLSFPSDSISISHIQSSCPQVSILRGC